MQHNFKKITRLPLVECTRRINHRLAYFDKTRQHMARLPSINLNTRTILICGYPNAGKSSFINKTKRVDVDVHRMLSLQSQTHDEVIFVNLNLSMT